MKERKEMDAQIHGNNAHRLYAMRCAAMRSASYDSLAVTQKYKQTKKHLALTTYMYAALKAL